MLNPKYTIFKDSSSEYRFNLKAKNSEIVLQSEGYTYKSSCENGIESVRVNCSYDSRYDRRESINGQYYFLLKA